MLCRYADLEFKITLLDSETNLQYCKSMLLKNYWLLDHFFFLKATNLLSETGQTNQPLEGGLPPSNQSTGFFQSSSDPAPTASFIAKTVDYGHGRGQYMFYLSTDVILNVFRQTTFVFFKQMVVQQWKGFLMERGLCWGLLHCHQSDLMRKVGSVLWIQRNTVGLF